MGGLSSRRGEDCAKTDPISAAYAGLGAQPRVVTSDWVRPSLLSTTADAVQNVESSMVIAECDYIPPV